MPDFTREEVIARVAAGQDLRRADLSESYYDKDTYFPYGFDPEAAEMVLKE